MPHAYVRASSAATTQQAEPIESAGQKDFVWLAVGTACRRQLGVACVGGACRRKLGIALIGLLLLLIAALSACTAQVARDCAHCPEMVIVPAGIAIVGAAPEDRFANRDEVPARTIRIDAPFAVSRFEITRGQYAAFVQATGRAVKGDCLTDRRHRGDWQIDADTTFRDPGFAQADDHPVACVSWDEAQAYVAWLNTQTRGGYRLLTEVEWEYVARGGASRNEIYPWGGDPAGGCSYANGFDATTMAAYKGMDTSGYDAFDPLPCADHWLNTAPVGSLDSNAFGVFDMIGNVSEWLADCYDASTTTCARRIAKGGSWGTLAHNLRTADRFPYPPTHRDDSIGIRVGKTVRD